MSNNNRNKLLIIVPQSTYLDDNFVFPPLGAMALKAHLDQAGIPCDLEDRFDQSKDYAPYSHFGYSVITPNYPEALRIRGILQQSCPQSRHIIGGPHVANYDVAPDGWDCIVRGDGQIPLERFVQGDPRKVYKRCDCLVQAQDLLAPWRENGFLQKYHYQLCGSYRTTTIMSAYGCPMSCAFCESARTKVRLKPVGLVEQELHDCLDCGFEAIMFFDDIFAINKKRVAEMTSLLAPLPLHFRCFVHARNFDDEMAHMLADAGCVEIGYGAEHAHQRILDNVNKKTTVQANYDVITTAHRHGIRVKSFLMVGLPGEDHETLAALEEFIATSGVDDFDLGIYYPYRGTHIRDHIDQYDLQLEALDGTLGFYKGKDGQAECCVRTSQLSSQDIRRAKNTLYRQYNKRFRADVPVFAESAVL
ncbi:MAG: radical SAM protein [Actinobacteria bacterium]|nr:radical SAM protein [Actinomycetota bacterium]